MTFRDKCNVLHSEMVKALGNYHKAEAAIIEPCSERQMQKKMEIRNKTYREWQEAQMVYNEFLELVVQLKKDLDDEM